ncbi:MAG: hypothetical protein HYR90_04665 [Candidatus Andersenbacteria bacterium]|nr:hypothetical protein [Candidatus Andersenbacteria bacterium]MBI3250435.1 hypothetical protein [Candidatus Andersenbacteria bacterium]
MQPSRQKEVGIVIIAALTTLAVALIVSVSVVNLNATLGLSWGVVAVVLLWAAITSLSSLFLAKWFGGRLSIIVTGLVTMFIVGRLSVASLVGGALLALFIFAAQDSIVRKSTERLRTQLRYILIPGIGLLIAGIAVAAFALSVPALREGLREGKFGLSEEVAATILAPVAPVISNMLPGYTPQATVDELISAQARQQLGDSFSSLPPQQLEQARQELARSLKLEDLDGNETVAKVAVMYSNDFLRRVTAGNGILAVIVMATIGLLAIRATVPLISWIPLFLAGALMWMAKKAGLVRIEQTQVTAERVEI